MNKQLILALVLIASLGSAAQRTDLVTDLRKEDPDLNVEFTAGTTPLWRLYVKADGSAYTNIAGWTGIVYFTESFTNTIGMSIPSTTTGLNYVEFQFTTNHTAVTAGDYVVQIMLYGTGSQIEEWRRGKLKILEGGIASGQPVNWNATNEPFSSYGPLAGSNEWTGVNNYSNTPTVGGISVKLVGTGVDSWTPGTGLENTGTAANPTGGLSAASIASLLLAESAVQFGDNWTNTIAGILASTLTDAVALNSAKFTYPAADAAKLAGIGSGATSNSTDVFLVARANHTGTQLGATISDLETLISNNLAVALNTLKVTYSDASLVSAMATTQIVHTAQIGTNDTDIASLFSTQSVNQVKLDAAITNGATASLGLYGPDAVNSNQYVNLAQLEATESASLYAYCTTNKTLVYTNGFQATNSVYLSSKSFTGALGTATLTTTTNKAFIGGWVFTDVEITELAQGQARVELYMHENSPGSASVSAHFELYDTVRNTLVPFGDVPLIGQIVAAGSTPTRRIYTIPYPSLSPTNVCYPALRVRVTELSGTPDIVVSVQNGYNSHFQIGVPIDVFTADLVKLNGSRPLTGNLNFGGFKGTNLLAGTSPLDAVNLTQLQDGTNAAVIDATNRVAGVGYLTAEADTLQTVVDRGAAATNVGPVTMIADLNMGGYGITGAAGVSSTNKLTLSGAALDITAAGVVNIISSANDINVNAQGDIGIATSGGALTLASDFGMSLTPESELNLNPAGALQINGTPGVTANGFTKGIMTDNAARVAPTGNLNFGGFKGTNMLAGTAPLDAVNLTQLQASIVNYAPDTTITVQRGTNDVLSAANLRTAYTAAKALLPGGNALSAVNRAVVIIPAGRYNFGVGDGANHGLELNAQFVDLVGMTGKREDVVLTSAITNASRGTVEQTADDVKISFVTMEITSASSTGSGATEASAYFPDTALTNAVLTDVVCKSAQAGVFSMRTTIVYAGTYTRVTGGDYSFGGAGTASGTFTGCTGGDLSFGGAGTASGTFTGCTGGELSFGGGDGGSCTASGTFTDCTGGDRAFGGFLASGNFIRCVGGSYSFGGDSYVASGTFTDCAGGSWSFGGNSGTASGTFTDCNAGDYSFGSGYVASGTFTGCTGGVESFGGDGGTVDAGAVFWKCFGVTSDATNGTVRASYDSSWNLIQN